MYGLGAAEDSLLDWSILGHSWILNGPLAINISAFSAPIPVFPNNPDVLRGS